MNEEKCKSILVLSGWRKHNEREYNKDNRRIYFYRASNTTSLMGKEYYMNKLTYTQLIEKLSND